MVKNKALIGYILLTLGLGYAVVEVKHTAADNRHRSEVVRAVICEQLKEQEKEAAKDLTDPRIKEILPNITRPQLIQLVKEDLEKYSARRRKTEPSNPRTACTVPAVSISTIH
jgi:hypothetical protein